MTPLPVSFTGPLESMPVTLSLPTSLVFKSSMALRIVVWRLFQVSARIGSPGLAGK